LPQEIADLGSLTFVEFRNNQLRGDVTALAGVPANIGPFGTLDLADGPGGNDCLTTTDPDLAAFLDAADPGWSLCENP